MGYLQHVLHCHVHLQVLLAVGLQPVVVEAIVVGGREQVARGGLRSVWPEEPVPSEGRGLRPGRCLLPAQKGDPPHEGLARGSRAGRPHLALYTGSEPLRGQKPQSGSTESPAGETPICRTVHSLAEPQGTLHPMFRSC